MITILIFYTLGYLLSFVWSIHWNKKSSYTIDKEILYALALCCILWPVFLVMVVFYHTVKFIEEKMK